MPVTIKKVDGFQVSTPGGVKAKGTTKKKAQRQANLLRGVEHGWKPTGEPPRDVKLHKQKQASINTKIQNYVNKGLSHEEAVRKATK